MSKYFVKETVLARLDSTTLFYLSRYVDLMMAITAKNKIVDLLLLVFTF